MTQIIGATNNDVTPSKDTSAELVTLPSIDDKQAFSDSQGQDRTNQQNVLPSTVGQRLLGSIITSSASGLGNGSFNSFLIGAGTSASFLFTVADNLGRTILAVPDISVYVNSISAANQWPNATYGMANLPVTVMNEWGQSNNINVVTRVVVRNNLAADTLVIVVCRWRIITNAVVNLAQADVVSGRLLRQATGAIGGQGGGS